MLNTRTPPQIQRNQFIPHITTPEQPIPYLDIHSKKLRAPRIPVAVDINPQILHQPERNPAVHPRLRPLAFAAVLGRDEEQGLDGRDVAAAVAQVVVQERARLAAEDLAVFVLFEGARYVGVDVAPPFRVREEGGEERVRVVGAHYFHVAWREWLG